MTSNDAPPAYVHTVYDETYRAKSYIQPSIMSMGTRPNLLGQLEYHSAQTDGSFAICVSGGTGVFVSNDLLESIPEEHRPALDTSLAGQSIELLMGVPMVSVGTTFLPFILTDAETGERMRIVLYAIVVPKLLVGMFIGRPNNFWKGEVWSGGVTFTFDFGQGGVHKTKLLYYHGPFAKSVSDYPSIWWITIPPALALTIWKWYLLSVHVIGKEYAASITLTIPYNSNLRLSGEVKKCPKEIAVAAEKRTKRRERVSLFGYLWWRRRRKFEMVSK
ncbi:hypothetical protein JOM56_008027 [Amanita muscaria]